jgi:hypothetical protein
MAISDDFQHLVEDEATASEGWKKLQDHFQRSTFSARMIARKEFHEITHDPSRPLLQYIHSVMAAKKKLKSLNCTVSEEEVKDVLLMRLDPSYDPVRISILAQKTEPSLEDIKSVLTSSSATEIIVKTEPMDNVLAVRVDRSQKADPIDDKGFRWCEIDRDGVCHRCGHPGHIAARCMFNMPQSVKNWIMSGRAPPLSSSSPTPHEKPSPSPAPQENAGFAYMSSYGPDSESGVGPLLI